MSGQLWGVNTLGGFMYSDELSNVLRTSLQPVVKFRQFCDAKDAMDKGLGRGQAYNWNTYSDVATGGKVLAEDEEMPTTSFTIKQQSLTVTELGNSVPYTGKLDNLSKQPVSEIIHKVLKNDAKKTIDGKAYEQFDLTPWKVQAASGTSTSAVVSVTSGSIGVTNNVAFRKDHVKPIVDLMKERNVPPYQGDDYFSIAWPSTFRTLKNDLEAIHTYVDQGLVMIMNGEIGRYEGMRFVEQTNIAKGGAEDSATFVFPYRTADLWNNVASDWIFFFGEDTVAEALVIPEEIRAKIPTDFGRSRGVAWYYLGGFGIVHGAAGDAVNLRILKWESAA
jgi:N4-gp56 family major capsid protein